MKMAHTALPLCTDRKHLLTNTQFPMPCSIISRHDYVA